MHAGGSIIRKGSQQEPAGDRRYKPPGATRSQQESAEPAGVSRSQKADRNGEAEG